MNSKLSWLWGAIIGLILGFPLIYIVGFLLDSQATIYNIEAGRPLQIYRELLYPGVDIGPIVGYGIIILATIIGLVIGIFTGRRNSKL